MKRIVTAALAALAIPLSVAVAPVASADPSDCYDPIACRDPGKMYYCPDTGTVMSIYGPCASLVTGPYAPGGLQPNQGFGGSNDEGW